MKYDNKKTCSHTIDLNIVLFINLIHIKCDKDGSFSGTSKTKNGGEKNLVLM